MYSEKDCYFCKYLCYFDAQNVHGYFCSLRIMPYEKPAMSLECERFTLDLEE